MKPVFIYIFAILIIACKSKEPVTIMSDEWTPKTVNYVLSDSLEKGTTYLSVYSQIYSLSEKQTHNLTATISLRNINKTDTVFITKAEYFNTEGKLIRTYFDKPIYLAPLETEEIVIHEADKDGGTGANFLFDWKIKQNSNEPLFEAVMISTSGQQGLSFATQGVKVK